MSRSGNQIVEFGRALVGLVKRVKKDYDAEGRFSKMRIRILGVFALDVAIALTLAFTRGPEIIRLSARYQKGFPSHLIVIRNDLGKSFYDVHIVMDDHWAADIEELKPGSNGFPIETTFHDRTQMGPPKSHIPGRLEFEIDGQLNVVQVSPQ